MDNYIAVIAIILAITNLTAFILMFADKRKAKKGAWRIPEKTLFIAAACFGALGGTAGMFVFRHKTKHWYFRVFFPLMLIVQIVLLIAAAVYFL